MVALILVSIFGFRPLVASRLDYNLYGINGFGGAAYAEWAGFLASLALWQ